MATIRNVIRNLTVWFKARPAPTQAAVLGALVLTMLGLFAAACKPATEHSLSTGTAARPTVTLASTTAISGSPIVTLSPAPEATAPEPPRSGPSMYGTVFYDWNGNGTQDWVEGQGEPPLPGLRICLDDLDSGLCAVSAETGQYLIDEVPPGEHNLLVDADPYSFLFVSVDAAAALGMEDVPVAVDGPTVVNIGLGDGPLTLPFLCGETGQLAGVSNYFDRDPRPGPVRDWMGGSRSTDGYTATTFDVQGQITVVASAPGVVNYVGPNADRYVVEVLCDDAVPWFPAGRSLWLYYYGLDEVSVERGDRVARGQTLGSYTEYGLETGSDLQRFSIRPKYTDGYGSYIFVDLFRDTQAAESRGLWTRDNDPACFPGP